MKLLAAAIVVCFLGLFYFYYGPIIYYYHMSTTALMPAALCTISALFDFFIIVFHVWSLVRISFFSLHIILVWSFVGKHHFAELNCLLALAVVGRTSKTVQHDNLLIGSSRSHVETSQLLRRFYQEHHWFLSIFQRFNKQLVSKIFFTAIVSNVTLNLVMVANVLFRELSLEEITMMLLMILSQTLLAFIGAHSLASISNCLYRSKNLLFRLQLKITGNWQKTKKIYLNEIQFIYIKNAWIVQKFKLAVFYETICTKNKFHFTFGAHSKISHKTMYEFLLVYTGFIMYVSKMVKNGRL